MRLNHNLASLNIYRNQVKNIKTQSNALNNISSGYKINNSKENPNVIAQSERMRLQIRGIQMASRNVQDGVSMLQTVDGTLNNATSTLHRIKELTVQAGGNNNSEDRQIIQKEIDELVKEYDNFINTSDFNGVNIVNDGSVTDNNAPKFTFMPGGANVDERVPLPKYNLLSNTTGDVSAGKLKDINVLTDDGLNKAGQIVDGSLNSIISARSKYGALQNRFESLYDNLDSMGVSIQGAESSLRDADLASEMIEFSRGGILIEAANAMLVQSNNFPREILRVLENVK